MPERSSLSTHRWTHLLCGLAFAVPVILLAGCSSGDDKQATVAPSAPALPSASAPASPSSAASASASAQPSQTSPSGGSPTVTPTPTQSPALAAAYAAIVRDIGARPADQCPPTDAGSQPGAKPCVLAHGSPDSPDRGVAAFAVRTFPGGYAAVYGRDTAGGWQFWYGTQQDTYHALQLPAEMRVCADGQGATVRAQPDTSATSAGVLQDGATVTADQFVLTQPGKIDGQGPAGNGWYQLTAPANGFIRADLLSVTRLSDCSLRDALVKSAAGR